MRKTDTAEMDRQADAERNRVPADGLKRLRAAAAQLRDVELEIADTERRLAELKQRRWKMEHEELPSLFDEYGVTAVDVNAAGNMPGCAAQMRPYYDANIAASWPPERQAEGFKALERIGLGDLIKTRYEVQLGRGTLKLAKQLAAALKKLKVDFSVKQSVHKQSLTAAVKERYKSGRPLGDADLSALGATVGSVVKLTISKED